MIAEKSEIATHIKQQFAVALLAEWREKEIILAIVTFLTRQNECAFRSVWSRKESEVQRHLEASERRKSHSFISIVSTLFANGKRKTNLNADQDTDEKLISSTLLKNTEKKLPFIQTQWFRPSQLYYNVASDPHLTSKQAINKTCFYKIYTASA